MLSRLLPAAAVMAAVAVPTTADAAQRTFKVVKVRALDVDLAENDEGIAYSWSTVIVLKPK